MWTGRSSNALGLSLAHPSRVVHRVVRNIGRQRGELRGGEKDPVHVENLAGKTRVPLRCAGECGPVTIRPCA
jgi:hypothetical protein